MISAFYYIMIVKLMYFDEPAPAFAETKEPVGAVLIFASALFVSPLGYLAIPWLGQAAAQRGAGHCSSALDMVTLNAARALFVAAIRTVAETGSTNDDVAALARDGAPKGLWLRAERQTGGKGRQGRAWHSPPGNLYASTLVRLQPERSAARRRSLWSPPSRCTRRSRRHAPARRGSNGPTTCSSTAPSSPASCSSAKATRWSSASASTSRTIRTISTGPPTSLAARARAEAFARAPRRRLRRLAGALAGRGARAGPRRLARRRPPARHRSCPPAAREGAFDGLDETGALRLRLADGTLRVIHAGDVFLI